MKNLKNMSLLEIDSIEIDFPPLIGSPSNIIVEPFFIKDKKTKDQRKEEDEEQKKVRELQKKLQRRNLESIRDRIKGREKSSKIEFKIQIIEFGTIFRISPNVRAARKSFARLNRELSTAATLALIKGRGRPDEFIFAIGMSHWIAKQVSNKENPIPKMHADHNYAFRILDSHNQFVRNRR